ncbi:MAG: tRNA epoxyqueuosine(34) reductase QueG [Pyrinomonadaceae bacterium]|nr:tRNA epoxyqueuosine(34) reductase QueG [Pyrinomonadaceae bacterium]
MVNLTEQIKRQAIEIGFDKIGIVRAEPLVEEGEKLDEWLSKGFHAEMKWLEREPEKRKNPALIFPDAKSVIVVALNYFTAHEHEESSEKGKVSRYAWGDDYHDVLKEKLRELLAFIKTLDASIDGKICVDTAPMMDKAWAVRAGLGWLGKHSNIITKEFGSWIFIGEIILNVELEYETETIEDHCGTCRKCLDACPTAAIVAPYVVDSKACLSYATIELRSAELPANIKENLDGWLYGCDICQDVCPWNRFEKPTDEARFEPRADNVSSDLKKILALSPETYAAKFRRSAMKRTKLGGLQRNARALLDKKSNQT